MEKQIRDGDFVVGLTVSELKTLIGDLLRDSSPNKTEEPEYLTAQEAADYLSYRLSTLYDMVHRRVIPFVKPEHNGRRLYFERAKLVEWKSARQFQTHEDAFQNHRLGIGEGRRTGDKSNRQMYLPGFKDKQEYMEFLHRNLREAKTILKILKFIQILILTNKKYETRRNR